MRWPRSRKLDGHVFENDLSFPNLCHVRRATRDAIAAAENDVNMRGERFGVVFSPGAEPAAGIPAEIHSGHAVFLVLGSDKDIKGKINWWWLAVDVD